MIVDKSPQRLSGAFLCDNEMSTTHSLHTDFLSFNGHDVVYTILDGMPMINLRSLASALGLDPKNTIKNAKSDEVAGPEVSTLTLQVGENGKKQRRKVTCIPEKRVYGWMMSLQSKSPGFVEFKKTCHDILWDHFHGVIGNRPEMLTELDKVQKELNADLLYLQENSEEFRRVHRNKAKIALIRRRLNKNDRDYLLQHAPELDLD